MATFGYTIAGSLTLGFSVNANQAQTGGGYVLSEPAAVSSVHIYAEGNTNAKAIITDADGDVLAVSSPNNFTGSASWVSFIFSPEVILSPGTYRLGFIAESNSSKMYFNSLSGYSINTDSNFSYSSPDATFDTDTSNTSRIASAYATYTPTNSPPTTTLNSPANNVSLTTTTPTLAFTATDPEGEDVSYQIQVSNSSDFSSLHMDATTTTYASGTQQTSVVSPALTQGGITYYWRVRAKDPSGSDSWGAWSATRTMVTEALPPSVTSGSSSSVATTSATVSGNVTATNGANITERGFVYDTSSNPTTSDSKKSVSGTTGSFNTSLTGLTSNTTYYWRAYATNSKGTTYGANKSFTTEPITPTVTTGSASGTSTSGFTVSASGVTSNPDSQTINEYGVVYSTSQNPTIADSSQTGTGTSADFDNTLSGLSENTTYYVRAYIKWRGTDYAYGSQISFKTQGRPAVSLNAPDDEASTSSLKPSLEFTGTDPETNTITYQLQLHTSDSFGTPLLDVASATNAGFSNQSDSKTDPFYSGNKVRYTPQSDLARGQDYYWRVRGKDTNGSNTWGEWTSSREFTVSAIAPSVNVQTVHDVTFDEAQVDAEVTADNGATITERGVVYSTSENPTLADDKETSAGTTGAFTVTLEDLASTTTYYVRAYATNAQGTTYSSQISFTTAQTPSEPTVVTGQAANTTDITSEFNGSEVTLDGTEDVVERGIVFSDTETTPTTDDRKIVAPSGGLGTFDLGMTGLDPSTTYYVRAYAINSIGTGYGAVETFTTEAPFVPDEGDGYWTWTPSGSDAVVGRSQSTPENSSADLMLADLGLEDNTDYTFYYSAKDSNNGETKVVLQWYDSAVKQQQEIAPDTPYTFTYDSGMDYWAIRLFVTGDSVEADNITATFNDMYLAQESEFSGFVPFVANGVTEVKIENNWLIDKQRADVITIMFDAVEGDAWYPFDITTEGLGWFEIGDRFTIQDADENDYSVVLWESKLTVDGGISESLKAKTPDLTETNYHKAGKLNGLWKRTQIEVDKNTQEIESLVEAVYDYDGVINTQFSEVFQDIDQVRTTIQGSGGVNLIKNSVMYAFDSEGAPESWTVAGTGSLLIQSSPESLTAGAVAGNAFTLSDETVTQTITVRKDVDFIPEDNKTYYAFSAKVKKNTVGAAHIKLINRNETLTIDLPDQEGYYWDTVKLEEILPLDDHYEIEIYSDADADLQVTDVILAPGKTKREWTQANGEVMNLSTTITEEGLTIRSPQFPNDYTKMDALGFEVHSKEVGGNRVFGFNKDETNVHKLKADKQISMTPLRAVPIDYDGYKGWAFTPSKEDS